MEWLSEIAQNKQAPALAAFVLGLMTAISPCPLATNISATAYIAKSFTSTKRVLLSGFLYTSGRMFSYTILGIIIYLGAGKFQIAKFFQGNGENIIGPVLIIIGMMMLGILKLHFLSKWNLTERISGKFKDRGLLGSFLLGMIFAFAFCPYSGALFFVMLIPMAITSYEGLILIPVFSAGTGLPVIFFAFVIAFSIERLGIYFKAVQKTEKIMRIAAGVTFIITGLYYMSISLKII